MEFLEETLTETWEKSLTKSREKSPKELNESMKKSRKNALNPWKYPGRIPKRFSGGIPKPYDSHRHAEHELRHRKWEMRKVSRGKSLGESQNKSMMQSWKDSRENSRKKSLKNPYIKFGRKPGTNEWWNPGRIMGRIHKGSSEEINKKKYQGKILKNFQKEDLTESLEAYLNGSLEESWDEILREIPDDPGSCNESVQDSLEIGRILGESKAFKTRTVLLKTPYLYLFWKEQK